MFRTPLSNLALLVLLLLVPLGSPGGLAAQAGPSPPAADALFRRLEPQTPVRVELRDGSRAQGRFDGLTPHSIRLSGAAGLTEVELDRLTSAWVRGRQTKTGAIVGGIAGTLFGAFIATIANATCDTEGCGGSGTYFKATAIFLPAGALIGAGVGSAFPRWRRIFP